MPFQLQKFREQAEDAAGAAYRGLSATRINYRERRRLRGESSNFSAAFSRASFIGGWLAREEAELLFELAAAVPEDRDIVEIGSYLGRSTAFLAQGSGPGRIVHGVDPHTSGCLQLGSGEDIDTSTQFLSNMTKVGVDGKVQAQIMKSVDGAHSYKGKPVGLLFVDGNHSEAAVYDDGKEWAPHLARGAFIAFDDIAWHGVTDGVRRLVGEGIVPPLEGRVGKIALCGPKERWPERVKALVQPVEARESSMRNKFRDLVRLPRPGSKG